MDQHSNICEKETIPADLRVTKRYRISEYLLMYLFLAISGMPFFQVPIYLGFFLFPLIIFTLFLKPDRLLPTQPTVRLFFIVFLIIYILQFLFLSPFWFSYPVHFAKLYCAFLVVNILRSRFLPLFFRVMLFLIIVSLIIYLFLVIVPGAVEFISDMGLNVSWTDNPLDSSLLLYHCNPNALFNTPIRNSGAFWEPGAYAGFLIITFMFRFAITKELWSKYNIIVTIALITTFSSAGYCVFGILVFLIYVLYYRKYIAGICTLLCFLWLFFSVDILYNKFISEFQDSEYLGLENFRSRYSSIILDLISFIRSPIIGLGFTEQRFDQSYGDIAGGCSGVTDFLVRFGIIGFLFFHFMLFRSFKNIGEHVFFGFLGVIGIILIGFSEVYYYLPLTFSLIFLDRCSISSSMGNHHNTEFCHD